MTDATQHANAGSMKANSRLEATLACPICRSALTITDDGATCAQHGFYRRKGRMFSFLRDAQTSFDAHWSLAAGTPRPHAKAKVAQRFLRPLTDSEANGAMVLDVGCGDGVHVQELLRMRAKFDVAGIDYSESALTSAAQIQDDWLPVHGDAQQLPFCDGAFDATISFGVQAYLDDMHRGMSEMVRVTRPGGLLGLWFAPPRRGVTGAMFSVARSVVPRLPRWAQNRVADALVPLLGFMPTSSGLSLRTGTWRECREVILVNIAPAKVSFPSRAQIEQFLTLQGCELATPPEPMEGEYWVRKQAVRRAV